MALMLLISASLLADTAEVWGKYFSYWRHLVVSSWWDTLVAAVVSSRSFHWR